MYSRRKIILNGTKFFTFSFLFSGTFLLNAKAAEKAKASPACSKLIDMSGKKRKDENNSKASKLAKNLGYVEDIDKATKAGTAKRKAKDDHCLNCMFYVKVGDGKTCGTCKIIPTPDIQVHANGWCKSWIKGQG